MCWDWFVNSTHMLRINYAISIFIDACYCNVYQSLLWILVTHDWDYLESFVF